MITRLRKILTLPARVLTDYAGGRIVIATLQERIGQLEHRAREAEGRAAAALREGFVAAADQHVLQRDHDAALDELRQLREELDRRAEREKCTEGERDQLLLERDHLLNAVRSALAVQIGGEVDLPEAYRRRAGILRKALGEMALLPVCGSMGEPEPAAAEGPGLVTGREG